MENIYFSILLFYNILIKYLFYKILNQIIQENNFVIIVKNKLERKMLNGTYVDLKILYDIKICFYKKHNLYRKFR